LVLILRQGYTNVPFGQTLLCSKALTGFGTPVLATLKIDFEHAMHINSLSLTTRHNYVIFK
jgi:hypothetical protein